jgi:hypothetical protein
VLIYTANDLRQDEPIKLCLAVLKEGELVVASTRMDAAALGELVHRHMSGALAGKLHSRRRTERGD